MSETFVTVARVGEIPAGGLKEVRLGDRSLAIFHVEGAYHAIEDICTHDGGPLAEGMLEGHVIECPRHGARFDVRTGAVLSLPAITPVPTFEVRVQGDEIQVKWRSYESSSSEAVSKPAANATEPRKEEVPARSAAPPPAPASADSAAAPTQQEIAIRSALETVMDPEINLSVIDLGLIRTVSIQPGRTRIEMLLTTPFCPYAPQLIAEVKQAAQSVVAQECDVEILPDPWSPELMPDPSLLGFSY